jgi:hypothetical protein
VKPVSDMLQILGLLAQLESISAIDYLDESVWRGIFVVCAACGGDFMRRVACIVYEASVDCRLALSGATFGQYQRALMAVKKQYRDGQEDEHGAAVVDSYVHLEELGLTWFTQRIVLAELSHSLQGNAAHVNGNYNGSVAGSGASSPVPAAHATPTKTGMFSSLFGSNKNSPAPGGGPGFGAALLSPLAVRPPGPRAAKAALLVARAMQLQSGMTADSGYLVLLSPRGFDPLPTYIRVGGVATGGGASGGGSETDEPEESVGARADKAGAGGGGDLAARLQRRSMRIRAEVDPAARAAAGVTAGSALGLSISGVSAGTGGGGEGRGSSVDLRARTSSAASSQSAGGVSKPPNPSTGSSWRDRLASMAGRMTSSDSSPAPVPPSRLSGDSPPLPPGGGGSQVALHVRDGVIYGNSTTPPPNTSGVVTSREGSVSAHVSALQLSAIAADHKDFSDDEEEEEEGEGEDSSSGEELGEIEERGEEEVLAGLSGGVPVTPAKPAAAKPEHETTALLRDVLASYPDTDREARRRTAVVIHCRTECAGCGFSFLEEETMCLWSGSSAAAVAGGGLNVDETCEDIHTTHRLVCRQCRAEITPMLHISYYDSSGAAAAVGADVDTDTDPAAAAVPAVRKWSTSVAHLSPYGVRFELERLLLAAGHAQVSSRYWLLSEAGTAGRELYWNALWYATRTGGGCPIALVYDEPSAVAAAVGEEEEGGRCAWWHEPAATVLVSFRRLTLQAKLRNFFLSSAATSTAAATAAASVPRVSSLRELLPSVSEADAEAVAGLVTRLLGADSGTAGDLRKLLLELISLRTVMTSLMSDRCCYTAPEADAALAMERYLCTPEVRARSLYVCAVTLVSLYRPNTRVVLQSLHELTNGSERPAGTKQIMLEGSTLAVLAKVGDRFTVLCVLCSMSTVLSHSLSLCLSVCLCVCLRHVASPSR